MKLEKKQLIENSKVYFENPEVSVMIATTDGQYFYPRDMAHAKNYCNTVKGVELVEISRADVFPVEEDELELILIDYSKEDLLELGKKVELKLAKNLKTETIIEKLIEAGLTKEMLIKEE
jgi:hypothetical protein